MERTVSASEANRKFSMLLRGVREGRSYTVTAHGKPVARLAPVAENGGKSRTARAALVRRLRAQRVLRVGRWNREELYQD